MLVSSGERADYLRWEETEMIDYTDEINARIREADRLIAEHAMQMRAAQRMKFDALCDKNNIHVGDIVKSEKLGANYKVIDIEFNPKALLIGMILDRPNPKRKSTYLYDKWTLVRKGERK